MLIINKITIVRKYINAFRNKAVVVDDVLGLQFMSFCRSTERRLVICTALLFTSMMKNI